MHRVTKCILTTGNHMFGAVRTPSPVKTTYILCCNKAIQVSKGQARPEAGSQLLCKFKFIHHMDGKGMPNYTQLHTKLTTTVHELSNSGFSQ